MRAALAAAACALAACAELPAVPADVCGNGVVEPAAGEECDGAAGCGAPATANACFFECAVDADCPEGGGYQCGGDGRCRLPTGRFVEAGYQTAATVGVSTADVDGDGAADLLGFDSRGLLIRFGDADLAMASSSRVAAVLTTGLTATPDADRDGARDLALPVGELGFALFVNDGGRELVPAAQSAIDLDLPGGCQEIAVGTFDGDGTPLTSEDTVIVLGGLAVGFLSDDACAASPADCAVNVHREPGGPLVAPGVTAAPLGFTAGVEPGEQFTLGVAGQSWVSVWGLAAGVARPERVAEYQLPEPLAAHGFVALLEVDGDGCADLVIDTGASMQVARSTRLGPLCTGLAPTLEPGARPPGDVRIAGAGDLTGDGTDELLYVPASDPDAADPVRELGIWVWVAAGAWDGGAFLGTAEQPRAAAVLDHNRDGWRDVVVATHGAATLDFYLNYEGRAFNRFTADVGGEPRAPVVGDFDGDLHDDVIVALLDPTDPDAPDRVEIVWGDPSGRPESGQFVGDFDAIARLTPTDGGVQAGMDSVVVTSNRLDPDDCRRGLALLLSDTSRQLLSPYVHLVEGGGEPRALAPLGVVDVSTPDEPRVLAFGALEDDATGGLGATVLGFDGDAYAPLGLDVVAPAADVPAYALADALGRAGDLDGDGVPEVVALALDRAIVVATAGTITIAIEEIAPALAGAPRFELADVDGDGDLDAVGLTAADARVWIAWNDGGALDVAAPQLLSFPPGMTCADLDVIDADASGRPRLAALCSLGPGAGVALVIGAYDPASPNELAELVAQPVPGGGQALQVADFSGDGLDDVAVLGRGTVRMVRQCRTDELGCRAGEPL